MIDKITKKHKCNFFNEYLIYNYIHTIFLFYNKKVNELQNHFGVK